MSFLKKVQSKYIVGADSYEDKCLRQYLETAIWSSNDGDKQLDEDYGLEDFAPEAVAQARKDVQEFLKKIGSVADDLDIEQLGHDFWLTRNGHGTGFWDRGYDKDIESVLMKAAKSFKENDPYVGDDGKIYFS